jgi:hypothetical protein
VLWNFLLILNSMATVVLEQRPRGPRNQQKRGKGKGGGQAWQPKANLAKRELAVATQELALVKREARMASGGKTPRFPKTQQIERRAKRGTRNPYFMTLIYPERFTGVRYPDGHSRQTCMAPLVNEFEPPFFPSTSVVEPPGDFWCVYRPSLVHPMWAYGPISAAATGTPYWALGTDTTRYGVSSLNDEVPAPQEQSDQLFLPSGVPQNLNMPLFYSGASWVNDPIFTTDANGNNMFGYPLAFGSSTATLTMNMCFSITGSFSTGDTVAITVFTAAQPTGVSISTSLTAGATPVSLYNATAAAIQALLGPADPTYGTGCLALGRGSPLGFRITYTAAGGTLVNPGVLLSGFTAKIGFTGTYTAPISNLMLYPTDWKDQANLLGIATVYRPVSASLWSQWVGSTLTDGGNLSQVMYRGGAHPWQAAIQPYTTNNSGMLYWQGVGTTPHGYSDKAKVGGYSYWLPVSDEDTNMRAPINSSEWFHPYIVVAGSIQANNVAAAGYTATPLKLRYCANIEYVTAAQYVSSEPSRLSPRLIEAARVSLVNAPTSMENDSHLSTIYNWLKNAGHDVMEWGVRNGGWLVPAAQAAFAGASMFL